MKKTIRIIVVVLVVLAMVLAVKHRKAALQKAKPYGMRPVAVRVASAERETLERSHHYLGTVEPWQTARISSRVSARVDGVFFREGDRVEKGDLLLQLDDSDLQAELKAMESTIQSLESNEAFWKAEDERDQKLAKEQVISAVDAETTHNRMMDAVSRLAAQRSTLASLKTKLAYTRLTSPFDGQVVFRDVDPGDLAAPGKPLMGVEDRSSLKISFDAPQEDLAFLKKGLAVRATVAGQPMEWRITRIYPRLDRARMARVEAKVPAVPALPSGATLSLHVVVERHEGVVAVPRECLMQRAPADWVVFTVADGKLHLRPVQRGLESGGRVEIQGLEPGEKVVVNTFLGWANLADGLKAEVVK